MDIVDFVVSLLIFSAGFVVGAFWVSAKGADAREDACQEALLGVPAKRDVDVFVRAASGLSESNRVQPAVWAPNRRRPIT